MSFPSLSPLRLPVPKMSSVKLSFITLAQVGRVWVKHPNMTVVPATTLHLVDSLASHFAVAESPLVEVVLRPAELALNGELVVLKCTLVLPSLGICHDPLAVELAVNELSLVFLSACPNVDPVTSEKAGIKRSCIAKNWSQQRSKFQLTANLSTDSQRQTCTVPPSSVPPDSSLRKAPIVDSPRRCCEIRLPPSFRQKTAPCNYLLL